MNEVASFYNDLLIQSGQIAIVCMLLPIAIGLFKWASLDKALKVFFVFCVVTLLLNLSELCYVFAVEAYTDAFKEWLEATNNSLNFMLIFYQLVGFLLLGYFFSLILAPYGYQKGIWYLSIGLSLFAVLAYVLEEGWKNYGTFGPASEAIFIVFIPLAYLWFLSRKNLGVPLFQNPYFLISLGLVLPNLIGLFLYFTGNELQENHFSLFAKLTIIKNIFTILGLFLFALGFWRSRSVGFTVKSSKRVNEK